MPTANVAVLVVAIAIAVVRDFLVQLRGKTTKKLCHLKAKDVNKSKLKGANKQT